MAVSRKWLTWGLLALLVLPLMPVLWGALFGWNWARAPLQRMASERTGRQLLIGGDLEFRLGWPAPRLRAGAVSFANPAWAIEKQMLTVASAEVSIDLPALLAGKLVFPEVRLHQPVVFLEKAADGRKSWLLDLAQSDEQARIPIGRLSLDQGQLGYDDQAQQTRIRADISSQSDAAGGAADNGVHFRATGRYQGLALVATGSGGSVLALHDESAPYPLQVEARIGPTGIKLAGTVTSLLRFTAVDMQLALRGGSLAQLFPLSGMVFPETRRYAIAGHVVHGGQRWRYEKFSGTIGNSDIAGSLQVDRGGKRPLLSADLVSKRLDIADLGPLIGARRGPPVVPTGDAAVPAGAGRGHLLPDIPFRTERWNSIDADVHLRAGTILRARELPLDNLQAHLTMQDALLTLDPLDFAIAGGHLQAAIVLDGRQDPIRARARISARKIQLARLFPTVDLAQRSVGQLNGEFDLSGQGSSVGRMLAGADGRVGLVVSHGEISKLLMEKIGLHLLEIIQLKLIGDKTVKLNCFIADFGVKRGLMTSHALVLDTEVSTIVGTGTIDLGQERLDLTLVPATRATSPVAFRSPIHVRGPFVQPEVSLDKARLLARGAGALALGLINPALIILPLIEMGPGVDSPCARLIPAVRASLGKGGEKPAGGSAP